MSRLPAEDAERLNLLNQAMDALRRALAAGYGEVTELKKDTSLDPLRERDDFKKLVADLDKKR